MGMILVYECDKRKSIFPFSPLEILLLLTKARPLEGDWIRIFQNKYYLLWLPSFEIPQKWTLSFFIALLGVLTPKLMKSLLNWICDAFVRTYTKNWHVINLHQNQFQTSLDGMAICLYFVRFDSACSYGLKWLFFFSIANDACVNW